MSFAMSELAKVSANTMQQLDVVSHNIANIGTPGFKVEHLYPGDKTADDKNAAGDNTFISVDHSPGMMRQTDNVLDVAIQGEGFFTIQTKAGTAYTRKGNFTVDRNNQLTTQAGDPVLGEAGPILIKGNKVEIDNEGGVRVDDADVGNLKIVRFENLQNLTRHGDGQFFDPGTAGLKKMEKPDVHYRNLEMANVNPIMEMAQMIGIQRSFESYQKVILTISDMDRLSISRIGRLA